MNNWLIILVGVIYIIVAIQLAYQHKYALSLTFFAYALSNIGLYLASL